LCLVCSNFRAVVTPILYEHIALDDDTYQYFVATSRLPATPLVHTRSVVLVYEQYSKQSFESIARVLLNISAFTGPSRALAEMFHLVDRLTLSSAHLTDLTFGFKLGVTEMVHRLTRLHLLCELRQGRDMGLDLSSSHVEYLALDLLSYRRTIDVESVDLSPSTSLALSPLRLRRALFRPRCVRQIDVQRVAQKVVEWAKNRCDQRIYVDDTFVPFRAADRGWHWEELEKRDAMEGDSLWLGGRQAWYPQPRSLG
ncbi:hypothetical protein EXIGLDRAFT_720555, partial [Exidia glandulosa HHB12029]